MKVAIETAHHEMRGSHFWALVQATSDLTATLARLGIRGRASVTQSICLAQRAYRAHIAPIGRPSPRISLEYA